MKKFIFLLLITAVFMSCSLDKEPDRNFVVLPVESVVMPDSYTAGSVSQIMIKYRRPTQCHIFDGFYFDVNGSERTIAIQAVKLNQNNCTDDTENLYEIPFDFRPTVSGEYTIKFWLGTDDNGIDQYLVHEIIVQ